MTKQTKMLLGVGALAVVGYLVYTKTSGTKANAIGSRVTDLDPEACNDYGTPPVKLKISYPDGSTRDGWSCKKPKKRISSVPPKG